MAPALSALGLVAHAVGDPAAPPTQSSDETNCKWCKANGAILVTHDRGKGDKEIIKQLAAHGVGALFVLKDLRAAPPKCLALALLTAESNIDLKAKGRQTLYHRLKRGGGLEKRDR